LHRTGSHKRTDSVESQVIYKNKVLGRLSSAYCIEDKLESAIRNQYELENKLESYEDHIKHTEVGSKTTTKRYQDLQKKFKTLEYSHSDLKQRLDKIEEEKYKISEKWVK
jgi:chromosome segregation ATPase